MIASSAAVLAITGLVAVAFVVRDRDRAAFVELPEPTDPPPHVLALAADGKLQILTTATGRVVRTVRDGIEPSRAPIVATPDGRWAYLDRPTGDCDGGLEVVRVDLRSGATRRLAAGRAPVVSHDGRLLAYVKAADGPCDAYDTLVVRRLADGHTRRWAAPSGNGITYLRWSLDDRSLAYTLLEDQGFSNRMIDATRSGPRLDRAPEIVVRYDDQPVGFLAGGSILVMHARRNAPLDLYAAKPGAERLLTSRPEAFVDAGAIAVDSTGKHILWVERRSDEHRIDVPGSLVRLALGSIDPPATVGAGYLSATWLERGHGARGIASGP